MVRMTTQVLTCIDGSNYLESVCQHAAWMAKGERAPIHLLNVQAPFQDWPAPTTYADAIGMAGLMDQFAELEAAHKKLELQRSNLVIKHAEGMLQASGLTYTVAQPVGALVDTVAERADAETVIVIGKRGEHAEYAVEHLGSNLERVVRVATGPVLVVSPRFRPIRRVLLAYDGGGNSYKALEYVMHHPIFADVECHVLGIGHDDESLDQHLHKAVGLLTQANRTAVLAHIDGDPAGVIQDYIVQHDIDMLLMGAYRHSALRRWFIGSTTNELLQTSPVSVMLFR
jgi:nucleotide-binding universal stress UspA family protein